jgi:hypothetical protein
VSSNAPAFGQRQPESAPGAVPAGLRADEQFIGEPWIGEAGITESVGQIVARDAAEPLARETPRVRRIRRSSQPKTENPDAPSVSSWPERSAAAGNMIEPKNPQTIGVNWTGTHASESCCVPPDSVGAVGPTQVLVLSNGRFKVYDKAGVLGGLNVSDSTFFASVRGSGADVSDPHVRFDRSSNRWFITEIDIPACECSNRILIAVSSGPTITNSSSFTFFQFQHDTVGTTPNVDTGGFADYDTLGVDANALYIGINEFDGGAPGNQSTTGYVVRKSALLSGSLVVTAFRGMALCNPSCVTGPFSPQGVDNDNPSASEGYFVGVDFLSFSKLTIRRISNPGGTPSISGNIFVTVPTTTLPLDQVQQGSSTKLEGIDDRLFAAAITKNQITGVSSLWTAHNIAVNASGVAGSGDRNGMRWYQLDDLTSAPTLTQSGTLFDSSASNPKGYWMGSVAANGQGHMALIASFAGAANFAGVAAAGRLSSDASGTTQTRSVVVDGCCAYVDFTGFSVQRWGDYSQVVVDPTDDQTMWAFAEFTNASSTTDSWGVRAVKLVAAPPAALSTAVPSSIKTGIASTSVSITGTTSSGSAFFDPGSDFANRLTVQVSGGVTVNSVTFVDATHVTVNVSTVGTSTGAKNVVITNPDGQQATGNSLITVTGMAFTDDVLTSGVTMIKAVHVTELRTRIDAVRAAKGLAAFSYTDPTLTVGSMVVKAVHITEMRTALSQAYVAAGRAAPTFTDPDLSGKTITTVHINELRTAVVDIE